MLNEVLPHITSGIFLFVLSAVTFFACFISPIIADERFEFNTLSPERLHDYFMLGSIILSVFVVGCIFSWWNLSQLSIFSGGFFTDIKAIIAYMPIFSLWMVMGMIIGTIWTKEKQEKIIVNIVLFIISILFCTGMYLALTGIFN